MICSESCLLIYQIKNMKDGKNQKKSSRVKKKKEVATVLNIDENIESVLCYAFGFFSGILFLLIEKENKSVRFHAMQSLMVFGAIFLVSFVPVLGWIVSAFLVPLSLVLWVFLMYKAYQGEKFKLPVIGDLAEKQLKKM